MKTKPHITGIQKLLSPYRLNVLENTNVLEDSTSHYYLHDA